jgi:hypothetical protein
MTMAAKHRETPAVPSHKWQRKPASKLALSLTHSLSLTTTHDHSRPLTTTHDHLRPLTTTHDNQRLRLQQPDLDVTKPISPPRSSKSKATSQQASEKHQMQFLLTRDPEANTQTLTQRHRPTTLLRHGLLVARGRGMMRADLKR